MIGKVLHVPEMDNIEGPLIFLAGPIMGAYNWQSLAIQYIQAWCPSINIANPRRPITSSDDFKEYEYNQQVDWETYHLRRASTEGCILFWLAKEYEHLCNRAYAQTTRFELAEWKIRHERDATKLVVGIEEGFTGAKYIKRRLSQDCPLVPISSSLEQTCKEAIKSVIRRKYTIRV